MERAETGYTNTRKHPYEDGLEFRYFVAAQLHLLTPALYIEASVTPLSYFWRCGLRPAVSIYTQSSKPPQKVRHKGVGGVTR